MDVRLALQPFPQLPFLLCEASGLLARGGQGGVGGGQVARDLREVRRVEGRGAQLPVQIGQCRAELRHVRLVGAGGGFQRGDVVLGQGGGAGLRGVQVQVAQGGVQADLRLLRLLRAAVGVRLHAPQGRPGGGEVALRAGQGRLRVLHAGPQGRDLGQGRLPRAGRIGPRRADAGGQSGQQAGHVRLRVARHQRLGRAQVGLAGGELLVPVAVLGAFLVQPRLPGLQRGAQVREARAPLVQRAGQGLHLRLLRA